MVNKIEFKDLSWQIKVGVVTGWILAVYMVSKTLTLFLGIPTY